MCYNKEKIWEEFMVRLWGKMLINEKVVKDHMLEKDENFSIVNFIEYVEEMCYQLDIPTPVILKYHVKNFFDFNNVKFLPRDFLEEIRFEEFVIENAVIKEDNPQARVFQ